MPRTTSLSTPTKPSNQQQMDETELIEEEKREYTHNESWTDLRIPYDIWENKFLSPNAKFLYGILNSFRDFNGDGVRYSNERLGSLYLHTSERTVSSCLGELQREGYISGAGGEDNKQNRWPHRRIKNMLNRKPASKSLRRQLPTIKERNKRKDSKESDSDPAGSPSTSSGDLRRKNPLIEHWNSLSHTPKHRDPSSKVYGRASQLITYLRHGQLGARCTIDSSWLKRKDIPIKWLTRKNSDAQIKRGLEFLGRLFDPAYWDQSKFKLPRNLGDLIYNPRARNSWYLACVTSPPKHLDVKFQDPRRSEGENRLLTLFRDRGEKEANQLKTIRRRIKDTEKWYNTITRQRRYEDFKNHYPHFGLFLLDYIEHLEENPDIPVHPAFLGPEAHHWNTRILDWIYDHIDIRIFPLKDEESDD